MELLNTEKADYMYKKLKTEQRIILEGKIRNDGSVECENICHIVPFIFSKSIDKNIKLVDNDCDYQKDEKVC